MAAKKKKVYEKSLPKPKYVIKAINPPTLDDDAQELHNTACQTKLDAFSVMLHQEDEARNYVAILAHNYERVCLALTRAHELLKEPNVAHAVNVAERIKTLEEQVARIDDLQSDLRRHESDYAHAYRDSYY
jgi:hypothetical protein